MLKVSFFQGVTEQGPTVVPLFGPADGYFEKVAAPSLLPEVAAYIESLRPEKDAMYVLVNAMGASEYYSSNINGDYFPEAALIHRPDRWSGKPVIDKITAKDWAYGFPTFYNAHPFAHHRNKDPNRAFGSVELAVWNDNMKRVELVTKLEREKCAQFGGEQVWDKLKVGQFPDVSMGTKVPFDTCTICLDRKLYREAWDTYQPGKHKHPGEAILAFHRKNKIRGLSITRKDYCFPPGVPVLLADGSWRPIQDVRVGDEVVTHTGGCKRVTCLLPSTRLDTAVRIYPWGLLPVSATGNHPFLSTRHSDRKGREQWLNRHSPDWVPAEDLAVGDLVFCPIPDVCGEEQRGGLLLGLYLAEGNLNFSKGVAWPKAASFTFSAAEAHLAEAVVQQARTLDPTLTYRQWEYPNAIGLTINSRNVAEWLWKMGGSGSLSKKLSSAVWGSGREFCREVLLGWSLGDGCRDSRNLRVVTSSEELARQMQLLAASLGILAGLSEIERTSNYCHQVVYYLTFCGDAADAVHEKRPQLAVAQQSKLFFWNKYLVSSIRELKTFEREGSWYNFEVEDDHSYVAGGYAVHNCEHALTMMNHIYPDGRKVAVVNDFPRFFDISYVFIGADKIAKTMLKIADAGKRVFFMGGSAEAAEKLGYVEEGEKVAKLLTKEDLAAYLQKSAKQKKGEIVKDHVPSQFASKAVPVLTKNEPELPKEILELLASQPFERALATTAGMGIVLRPKEFQKLVLIQVGKRGLADELDASNKLFPRSESLEPVSLSEGDFHTALARLLLPLLETRSALGPFIERRVVVVAGREGEQHKQASSHTSELLRKIGAAYNGYRQSVMEMVASSQGLLEAIAGPRDVELLKLSSALPQQLITPLSFSYLKQAFKDEVPVGDTENVMVKLNENQAEAGVQRGLPLVTTRMNNLNI